MPSSATIAAFATASPLLLVIPGPAVLYVVNRSVSHGRQAGLAGIAGLTLGNLVHAIAAAAGLSAVLATSGAALPFVQRRGAGTVFIGLGVVAGTASASHARSVPASGT